MDNKRTVPRYRKDRSFATVSGPFDTQNGPLG